MVNGGFEDDVGGRVGVVGGEGEGELEGEVGVGGGFGAGEGAGPGEEGGRGGEGGDVGRGGKHEGHEFGLEARDGRGGLVSCMVWKEGWSEGVPFSNALGVVSARCGVEFGGFVEGGVSGGRVLGVLHVVVHLE